MDTDRGRGSGISRRVFPVTGSGKYFRNIIVDPEVCLAIIELDETGMNYRIRWGLVEGGRPTSELPTHLMNHEVKKKLTNGKHRVIYHAHTTNTIALTFVLPLDEYGADQMSGQNLHLSRTFHDVPR